MMWRDTIDLIPIVAGKNSFGEDVNVDGPARTVYANRKSVRQSEFYQAMAVGIRPEIVFEIREMDYAGEIKAKVGDTTYRIIRNFSKNGEIIELVCGHYPMEG